MERRLFLGGLTAASIGVLLESPFTKPFVAQDPLKLEGAWLTRDRSSRLK
jgi:hypothetical protein